MTATIDHTPGRHAAADRAAEFLERVHALEVTAVRLAEERDAAKARAAVAEADAAGLLRVNLQLQRHLDEYGQDRRGYEQRIAELEAENERLRAADTLVLPKYVQTKRGWRRSR